MRKLLLFVCALFVAMAACAQDEPLVVNNETAGGLRQLLGAEYISCTNIKVTGVINGADVKCLREMAGFMPEKVPNDWDEQDPVSDYGHDESPCNCRVIDLSEAHIVKGGGPVYTDERLGTEYTIERDGQAPDFMFFKAYKLVSLTLPNELKKLPRYVAAYCPDLATVNIGPNVKTIGDFAIYSNPSMMSLSLPEGVKSLGREALSNNGYESLYLPGSITSVDYFVCENCDKLKNITFGEGYSVIGYGMFKWCDALENVDMSETAITSLATYAFSSCLSLKSISFPGTLKEIPGGAFDGCSKLENVEFAEGLETIGNSAFAECNLQTLVLPNSLTSLGSSAFCFNKELSSVTIGTGITYIPYYCFAGCNSLESLDLPDHVTEIDSRAYAYCASLKNLNFSSAVTTIGSEAFSYCESLEEVDIPDNVTTIGDGAFKYCKALKKATFGAGVATLPKDCFTADSLLQEVNLTDGMEYISRFCFTECASLKTIAFPATVQTIENGAGFRWTPTAIRCLGTVPPTGESTSAEPFFGLYDDCTLFVPEEALDAYEAEPIWEKFFEADNVKSLSEYTGINGVSANDDPAARTIYNVSGVRLNAPAKGLNIIRQANGKTVKVMVK